MTSSIPLLAAVEAEEKVAHQRGPPGLVRRAQALAGVSVEVLVEVDVVAEVRVALQLLAAAPHRAPPVGIALEDVHHALADVAGDLLAVHERPALRRAPGLDRVDVAAVQAQERADEQ